MEKFGSVSKHMASRMLLTSKVRRLLEALIVKGVPPITAGMVYGYPSRITSNWLMYGAGGVPKKPEFPNSKIDIGDGVIRTAEDCYKADLECVKLAAMVAKSEGKLVAGLARNLWGMSKMDPATARFMFKQYTHVHGIEAPKQQAAKEDEGSAKGDEDSVQVILPDNGRMNK